MQGAFSASVYVDVERAVCDPDGRCPVLTPDEKLISFDGVHLTRSGAKFAGRLVFEKTPLRELTPGRIFR